jgi:hypothetical protein
MKSIIFQKMILFIIISVYQTKSVAMTRKELWQSKIISDGEIIEQVQMLSYLVNIISNEREMDMDNIFI